MVSTKIPTLTATNYHVWSARIRSLAISQGVWAYVEPGSMEEQPVRHPPPTWRDVRVPWYE